MPHIEFRPALPASSRTTGPLPSSRRLRRTGLVLLTAVATLSTAWTHPAPAAAAVPLQVTRLVSGTPATPDIAGNTWTSDTGYAIGGQLARVTKPIKRATNQSLYRTERYGVTGYHIPVTRQTNRVRLDMAEHTWTRPGQRVFDISAEGRTVASNVDIVAAVGPMTAYTMSFTVTVKDGFLDLGFTNRVNVASITSLQVVSSGPAMPTATIGFPPPGVSPESFGAVGDGVTDDTAALQRAFDGAAGKPVVLTAGRTYAHAGVLHLRTAGLTVSGAGTLLATQEQTSSVWIEADRVTLTDATLTTASTTRRWDAWEQMGLRIDGHTGVVVRGVTVNGAAAAGIYVGGGAGDFVLDHVTVSGTRADGIHMTAGAHDGRVISPVVRGSGDDGVAVVSYSQDGAPCSDIVVSSPTVLGTTWGRGLSVVGGSDITETDIDVRDTSAAGIYLASEGSPWWTAATQDVVIDGGSITGANTDTDVDHGAVLVMSGENGPTPTDVTVRNLTIGNTRPTASRNLGVITYGTAPTDVLFSNIAITDGPTSAYQGNTPSSSYQLVGVTRNGVPVPVTG